MSLFDILGTILIEPLKLVFEVVFYIANKMIGHPGLAIIVLSLAINILVLPLYKRADAMQEQARVTDEKLQPGIKKIKKYFAGDERMMILQTYYRQNNYSPLSALNGSVSLLLEIPFFMAAYQFLSNLDILQVSSFGPIANLGEPDGLLVIGSVTINLLPVLMTLINVISSAIYLKGFPLKTKLQLYGMAAFFLVFLYNSPSGLVFYWTLNNLFSLGKNIFQKLKNPGRVIEGLCSVIGVAMLVFALFFYDTPSATRKLLLVVLGVAVQLPLVYSLLKGKWTLRVLTAAQPNGTLFLVGSLFLTVLIGLLIPSAVLASSPQEFMEAGDYYHPLWYLLSTFCLAAGVFLVWLRVFYWLASPTGKALFDKAVWVLCGITLIDYMAFGTDLGILSTALQFEEGLSFSGKEQLINLAAVIFAAAAMLLIQSKWKKAAINVMLIVCVALSGMSVLNIVRIQSSVSEIPARVMPTENGDTQISLSKTGKNVVVLMLDRAMSDYVQVSFNEKPELKEQFAGFTFYPNTLSFGRCTPIGVPAVFGGYEYTPAQINSRTEESIISKHNESLLVMPVLFEENDFAVTVFDPPIPNHQWISDTSIYDPYPNITTGLTMGAFSDPALTQAQVESLSSKMFLYSLMKSVPLPLQRFLYSNGTYNQIDTSAMQVTEGTSKAYGINNTFMNSYDVLCNLSDTTVINDSDQNTFLIMANEATHEPAILQTPDYVPAERVDNTEYDAEYADRFGTGAFPLTIENATQMGNYHSNMATMLKLGQWFDYLREQDVYDNTRIILVADHGGMVYQREDLIPEDTTAAYSVENFFPLLMVKDFDSTVFSVSEDLMTNADVPVLATDGLIENPVNPFTGKQITNDAKNTDSLWLLCTMAWVDILNDGNAFLPGYWARVELPDIYNLEKWYFTPEKMEMPEMR